LFELAYLFSCVQASSSCCVAWRIHTLTLSSSSSFVGFASSVRHCRLNQRGLLLVFAKCLVFAHLLSQLFNFDHLADVVICVLAVFVLKFILLRIKAFNLLQGCGSFSFLSNGYRQQFDINWTGLSHMYAFKSRQ